MNFGIGAWWGASALGVFSLVTISFFAFAVLGACGLQYAVLRAVAEAGTIGRGSRPSSSGR